MSVTLCCPCLFGLESVLAGEIRRMGGEQVQVSDGRVFFSGEEELIARANLTLRTAERVGIVMGTFPAVSFTELFDQVAELPFERYIGRNDAFPVKGWSIDSKLRSIPDCQSIIKKAAVRRMEKAYGQSWFDETGPVHQIRFSIRKDDVTVLLDTSGPGLHKRGYRRDANEAPIKETLAAGIVDLAHVRSQNAVIDPFCGSGTFLIESVLKALNIAPGIRRRFDAERWTSLPGEMWKTQREMAMDLIDRKSSFMAYGFDLDAGAVELSRLNASRAGVSSHVQVKQRDIRDFTCDLKKAAILCNPPYGERMLEVKQAEELYKEMGKVFFPRDGLSYYIIAPHETFEQQFGRRADKRRKLYNGMLKCNLYMYFK